MRSDLLLPRLVLIVFLSSLFFIHPSKALCVPRNSTTARPKIQDKSTVASPAPAPAPAPAPVEVTTSPPPVTVVPSNPSASKPITVVLPKIPSITAAEIAKVARVCHSTDYPALCVSSLKPYLAGKTDVISILNAEVQASKHLTSALIDKAVKLSEDPKTDPRTASLLQSCKSNYEGVMRNIHDGEVSMKIGDVFGVNSYLSAALTDFEGCNDLLSQGTDGPLGPDQDPNPADPAISSMISKDNEISKHLISNCLAIGALVHY